VNGYRNEVGSLMAHDLGDLDISGLRVLVVDDDKVTRHLVSSILDGIGVEDVQVEASGQAALDLISRHPMDLVISDFEMEPMNGLEFALHVRRDSNSTNPYVPIIMMTAHADRPTVMKARDAGVNAFVAKPVSPKALEEKIHVVLTEHRKFVRSNRYVGPDRRRRDVPLARDGRRKNDDE
jgi:two-component system, chemotaxis family, chemotaxis protein CheY